MKKILVTGGLGFIGSSFIVQEIHKGNFIINLDKVTYAANFDNVAEVSVLTNYHFVEGDICNKALVLELVKKFEVDCLVNFAAESHVDNSIKNADVFVETNVVGTLSLLHSSLAYYEELTGDKKDNFRFLHISTDEVFGSLKEGEQPFDENSPYRPNSPYSASKAASDHLVRAWNETYKLPTIITNCSNNYGIRQHQEKFIPTIIRSALSGKDIPIYGDGKNIRDWIYVEDHCRGIALALENGKIGESYCFGGECEMRNIEIANLICETLDIKKPRADKKSYKSQIKFVADRKGHDYRYAISNNKVKSKLGFVVQSKFADNISGIVEFFTK